LCPVGTLLFVLLFSMILVLVFCVTNKFDLIEIKPDADFYSALSRS